jgi:hypothetical protein
MDPAAANQAKTRTANGRKIQELQEHAVGTDLRFAEIQSNINKLSQRVAQQQEPNQAALGSHVMLPKGKAIAGLNYSALSDRKGSGIVAEYGNIYASPWISGGLSSIYPNAAEYFTTRPITPQNITQFNNAQYSKFVDGRFDIGTIEFRPLTVDEVVEYMDAAKSKAWRETSVHKGQGYKPYDLTLYDEPVKSRPNNYAVPQYTNFRPGHFVLNTLSSSERVRALAEKASVDVKEAAIKSKVEEKIWEVQLKRKVAQELAKESKKQKTGSKNHKIINKNLYGGY